MNNLFPHDQAGLDAITAALLDAARRHGATDAVASVSENKGQTAHLRQGRIRALSREVSCGLSLAVYIGQRQGHTHSTDFTPDSLEEMARAACAIAQHTQEDPFAGLPDTDALCKTPLDLDLYHPWEPDSETLVTLARQIEEGIADWPEAASDGAWASAGQSQVRLANSRGFSAGYAQSYHGFTASVLAARDDIRCREFWHEGGRRQGELPAAKQIGAQAAGRAISLLDQRPIASGEFPVLFDARSAISLLQHLCQAISGRPLYMKTSFLGERFGQPIFPEHIDVIEDPFIPGALASQPFDTEGISASRRVLVESGVLRGALLGQYSARRLGLPVTGNAGGNTNVQIASRLTRPDDDLAAMLRKLGTGLMVTNLSGEGARLINGDYSRAARGFWVERGEIRHAVDGVTIAGNLLEMWQSIAAIGADTFVSGAFSTGSILLSRMHVASR
ncbi:MAG: hypothetical protein CGU29_02050 [Candidatus Dactylopiibacterium carminicum]|uniref:Metalloprotease PmbA n=1 Tax=Candidatus Dactylopiibacterium carminicum TaxID=857335 RepID=A0A272EXT1_9RHOO|nr:metallopeptidase TldD-related protein [Candidatus Dactylopiibacterium carminicum]KAF7600512.1 hypothetical protein BGI27_02115 [Candidatus Dactylopiibacterium carminicum]PAS94919.1 MAG: hypothetical protein CGU29_02050 [Candidatus Dactylopiibacterium carminicum]PAT00517.1 MAG: hypothetical protein BSR46_02120 [Candidatus Dactylopiibacterium carminicum]